MQFTPYVYRVESIKVIDGDTLNVDIDLGFKLSYNVHVRLEGVNTPEITGPERSAGLVVKLFVQEWVAAHKGKLMVRSIRLDKYADRVVGDIVTDEHPSDSLAATLREKRYTTEVTKDGRVSAFTQSQLEAITAS
jgi:micrococcal nuclease